MARVLARSICTYICCKGAERRTHSALSMVSLSTQSESKREPDRRKDRDPIQNSPLKNTASGRALGPYRQRPPKPRKAEAQSERSKRAANRTAAAEATVGFSGLNSSTDYLLIPAQNVPGSETRTRLVRSFVQSSVQQLQLQHAKKQRDPA